MTIENVTTLPGVTRQQDPREPVPAIVEVCKGLLTMAQTGELRGIGFALVKTGGRMQRGYSRAPGGEADVPLTAAIGDLAWAIHAERDDFYDESTILPKAKE